MEPLLGQIELFPYTFEPRGWAICEGQLLPIAEYNALYALIGTQFGGNGTTTFALPDLRGKEPLPHLHYSMATRTGVFPSRE